jgi:hypothetical protein
MIINKSVIFLLAAVFAAHCADAADTVVIGRALDQREAPGEDNGCAPPAESPDTICIAHPWFQWTLSIDRTLSGPPLSGRVIAARRQHTGTIRSYLRAYRLFVVQPIEDRAERRRLGADYYLVDMSEAHYCISSDPEELGLHVPTIVEKSNYGDTYCFALH